MRNGIVRETTLLDGAIRRVSALLPTSWRFELEPQPPVADRGGAAVTTLVGPGGASLSFFVEARRSGTPIGLLLSRLREIASSTDLPMLFVSDYLGPGVREALTADGISYADATGWVRIASDNPLILLTGQGAAKAPRARSAAAVVRLNGVAASRIIRTLCGKGLPFGVRALASAADVSPGSVAKLLPTLAREGIVDRDERGAVTVVRRRALIQRWAQDYSFARTNSAAGYFIMPRGLERALTRLKAVPLATTLTGSAAARRLLPEGTTSVVPLRLLAIYTDAPSALVDELGLIPAEASTANTVIAVPQDGGVLIDDLAPVALVLADLLTLPGRSDAEAEQLMDALARTDQAWET